MKRIAYRHLSKVSTRITTFASALMLGLMAVVAAPTPASAHNELGWGWCVGQYVACVSTDANGYGGRYYLQTGQGYCRNTPVNDAISGIDSHYPQINIYFWTGAGCNGSRVTCGPLCTINNLRGTGYNDTFSSYCIGVNTQSSCGAYFP